MWGKGELEKATFLRFNVSGLSFIWALTISQESPSLSL